jgi:hypothetical protein
MRGLLHGRHIWNLLFVLAWNSVAGRGNAAGIACRARREPLEAQQKHRGEADHHDVLILVSEARIFNA